MTMTKEAALAAYLDISEEDIDCLSDDQFEAQGGEYLVLTDNEADDLFKASLEEYFDYALQEVPEHFRPYVDFDYWSRDASRVKTPQSAIHRSVYGKCLRCKHTVVAEGNDAKLFIYRDVCHRSRSWQLSMGQLGLPKGVL